MKNIKRILIWTLSIIILLAFAAIMYIKLALPDVGPAPDMKVDMSPVKIARGEYLANHVTVCIDCHSTRDWSRFSGPPTQGTYGMGGDVFDQKFGFPGRYYAANITPEGIGRYTDGELFRIITTGVTKEGKAIFPVMPYLYYGQMDTADINCIIAYIRTLKPIKNIVPKSKSDFPMNFILNLIPQKASFTTMPPESDVLNYGKYLVTSSGCVECHTPFEKGHLVKGKEFGGGREFPFPDGSIVRSGNISSDTETGIGSWSEATFLSLFHAHSDSTTLNTKLTNGSFNSVMPWTMYGGMKEEDLKAIFAYLKTVKAISNRVEKFKPAGVN